MRRRAQAELDNAATAGHEAADLGVGKDWYTVKEAAQLLGVHPKTVRKRVREGEIKASRPSPRMTRIHKRDLADYLNRTGP